MLKEAVMVIDYEGPEGVFGVKEKRIGGILSQGRMASEEALLVEV